MLSITAKFIVLVFAIGLLFGCDIQLINREKRQGETKMKENNEELKPVTLTTEINLQDKTLRVEYRVKNNTEKPIYLFNILWDFNQSGDYIPAPQPVYSCLQNDGAFHLSKQILPLPKNKRVELRRVPFVTKIEAGEEFNEKFELSVPLSEYNPYFPKKSDDNEENKSAKSIYLSVQYIREMDGLEVKPSLMDNTLSVWHQDLIAKSEILTSRPKTISVQVKKRTDYFEEF